MNRSLRLGGLALLGILSLTPGCGNDSTPPGGDDAGQDASSPSDDASTLDAGRSCSSDGECDDGLFCNGTEVCEAGRCTAGVAPSCGDGVACTRDFCSEERASCVNVVPDADGDGLGDATCVDGDGEPLGTDCDDADANRFPGNAEVCDPEGHDEDCDAATLGGLDADGDGEVSAACCNPLPGGGTSCGADCDDARRQVNRAGTEVCDGIDDDCDGTIDEGVVVMTYADVDRDGQGDPATELMACAGRAGRVSTAGDCDDTRADRRSGQAEFCDSIDNDCDGAIDEDAGPVSWYLDDDGDGFGTPSTVVDSCVPVSGSSLLGSDCDDSDASIHPAAAERCDGLDNDCSGGPDFEIAPGDREDDDGDGYVDIRCGAPLGVDCRDDDASAGPGELEICDGRDNDCDESIDEDVLTYGWYIDADGDGYGTSLDGVVLSCATIGGRVRRGGDCDDSTALRSPVAVEVCDGRDQDCDVSVDESPASSACAPIAGGVSACIAGTCGLATCSPGLADCDRAAANGCEVTLGSDPLHCGACGTACPSAPGAASGCSAGSCAPLACTGGRLDCNGDLTAPGGDGCEHSGGACPSCVSDAGCDDGVLCNGAETCDVGSGVCMPGAGPPDGDGDGLTPIGCGGTDCDDARADVRPGAPETCDGADQDCDARIDEAPTGPGTATYYRDADRDGAGDSTRTLVACIPPPDHVVSGGDCDDTRSDVRPGAVEVCDGLDQNCDGSVDDGGVCTPSCPPGQIACGTRCVDPMTDLAYCGASGSCTGPSAGAACGPGRVCSSGTCAPTCDVSLALCDGRCRDLTNDPMYCGDCSGACPTGPNAAPICIASGCEIFCQPGYDDCDANAVTGCEADLATSADHCGRCGAACPGEPSATRPCAGGACGALVCALGFLDCDGDLGTGGNGCETSGASCPRVLWATTWGDANDDWNVGSGRDFEMTSDAAGNLYAIGTYGGDVTVDGTSYSAARFAGIVVSLTSTGSIRWATNVRAGTTGDASPSRIVFDPSTGDVFVAGTGFGSEVLVGATSIGTQNGNCTAFLTRLAAATGAPVWGRTYPSASCSTARALTRTPLGDLAIGGSFQGTHVMDTLSVSNTNAPHDGWVAIVSASTGVASDLFRFGSATAGEQVSAIAGYADGDLVVAGVYDTAETDIGGRALAWGGSTDGFHARFTRAGSSVHATGISTASLEQLNDVVIGPSGDYYVAGTYDGSTTLGITTLSGSSYGTILARAGAADGAYAWVTGNESGGNAVYGIRRILVDASETVRVAWVTSAGVSATFGGVSMPSTGGNARVARVDGATGTAMRIESFQGPGTVSTNAIALLPDGRVATGGNFSANGSIDGVSFTNAGAGYDHYVMLLGPGL